MTDGHEKLLLLNRDIRVARVSAGFTAADTQFFQFNRPKDDQRRQR